MLRKSTTLFYALFCLGALLILLTATDRNRADLRGNINLGAAIMFAGGLGVWLSAK